MGSWFAAGSINKIFGLIPIFVTILLVGILVATDMRGEPTFNPPYLVLILNTLFLTATSFAVAYISAKSYLVEGLLNVLFLGSGVLITGLAAFIAGWVADSADHNVTIFNIGVLISSVAHVISVIVTSFSTCSTEPSKRRVTLIIVNTIVAVSIGIVTVLALYNITPIFFSNAGPTLIRQTVLSIGILFFFLSGLFFGWYYFKSKSTVLYWYSLALILFAIGLSAVGLMVEFNGILNWTGRIAQFLSGFYFLVALWSAYKKSR